MQIYIYFLVIYFFNAKKNQLTNETLFTTFSYANSRNQFNMTHVEIYVEVLNGVY